MNLKLETFFYYYYCKNINVAKLFPLIFFFPKLYKIINNFFSFTRVCIYYIFSCKLNNTYIITQEGEITHRNNQCNHTTSLYIILKN